jgi:nicotinamidase-related amidase
MLKKTTKLPGNAGLILIDLQKAIDHPSWGERNNPEAETSVGRLLDHWRSTSRPIVHIRHVSRLPDSTYRDGQPGIEFKEVAVPQLGELVLTKHTACAFVGTGLEMWLRQHHIEDIVIAGVITNNSVEATARVAGDLGFRTIVVSDATFTFGRPDFSGRSHTAGEVHAMSLANLDGEYASVCTTEEVLRRAST